MAICGWKGPLQDQQDNSAEWDVGGLAWTLGLCVANVYRKQPSKTEGRCFLCLMDLYVYMDLLWLNRTINLLNWLSFGKRCFFFIAEGMQRRPENSARAGNSVWLLFELLGAAQNGQSPNLWQWYWTRQMNRWISGGFPSVFHIELFRSVIWPCSENSPQKGREIVVVPSGYD